MATADERDPAVRDIHQLGGSTAFYRKSPLTTVASLNRMAGDPSVVADIRTVLGQAGIPTLADDVVAALDVKTSAMGGLCSDATPAAGTIVECDVRPGETLDWMAYRPQGKAGLGLLRNIRWAGKKAFRAYLFRVTSDNRAYTFVVPKVCGNLSLLGVEEIAHVAIAAPPPEEPAFTPAAFVIAPPPREALPFPGIFAATGGPLSAQLPPAPPAAVKASPFFIDVLIGKDRRVRPIAGRTTTNGMSVAPNAGLSGGDFAQCSPLIGLKVGLLKRFENDWELAGAIGVAISLVHAEDKVKQHELFADVEANRYLNGGAYLGTGLSLWDLTHSDSLTPAWMFHFGIPLGIHPAHQMYFVAESRLFLDQLDDYGNNYQFWGGVRVHF